MSSPNWNYIIALNVILWSHHTRATLFQSTTDDGLTHENLNTRYLHSIERCRNAYSNLSEERISRLLDASGQQGSGIFGGNTLWFGSYSECTKLSNSRYCWTLFPGSLTLVHNTTESFNFQWGVCMPDICTGQDVYENLDFFLHNVSHLNVQPSLAKPFKVECAEDPEYTSSVVITIVFCGFLIGICLLATVVEIFLNSYKPRDSAEIVENGSEISMDKNIDEITPLLPNGPDEVKTTLKDKTRGSVLEFLNCFSCPRNIKFIMNTDVGKSDLTYLHGIRVLSMFWVIYIHTNQESVLSQPVDNLNEVIDSQRRFTNMISINGAYGVDTFFVLSGLLVMYVNMKKQERNSAGGTNWFKYYFHRFWRLTPTYMFCILLLAKLRPFCGAGPVWFSVREDDSCAKHWWINLLYINNFHKIEQNELCIGPAWYLAADMQFFIISPIFLLIAKRYKLRPLLCVVGVITVASIITTASLIADKDLIPIYLPDIRNNFQVAKVYQHFKDVYVKPYCRIPPYVMGMVLGYVIYKYFSKRFQLKWKLVLAMWILAVCVALADIYAPYSAVKENPRIWTKGERVVYGSLRWTIWSFCIIWLIFACHYNYAGPVKALLAAKFWIPLSRINYVAFIMHNTIIKIFAYNIEAPIHYTVFTLVTNYLTALVLSYAVAFIITVVVEQPCASLEALVWKKVEKK